MKGVFRIVHERKDKQAAEDRDRFMEDCDIAAVGTVGGCEGGRHAPSDGCVLCRRRTSRYAST